MTNLVKPIAGWSEPAIKLFKEKVSQPILFAKIMHHNPLLNKAEVEITQRMSNVPIGNLFGKSENDKLF